MKGRCVKGNERVNWLRATIGLLILSSGCTILLAGSPSPCKGEFCVEISSSFYSKEQCITDKTQQCTYANVYFTAKNGTLNIPNLTAKDIEMTINDRQTGVEGSSALTQSNGLVVQLLLDRSFSITKSNSTAAVKSGASQFIRSLSDAALISVSVFASEDEVPLFLTPSSTNTTSTQTLYNKAMAEQMVQQFYTSYPSETSLSQTKLYEAVGNLGGKEPTGSGAERLQRVMVIFTDGADSVGSTRYPTPDAVRQSLYNNDPNLKVYAIGLGDEPKAEALGKIASDRFYRAINATELQKAFDEVSKELTAIYLFKVLVPSTMSGAVGRLKVTFMGTPVEQTFPVSTSTITGAGGGGGGGGGSFTPTVGTGATPTISWTGDTADALVVSDVKTGTVMWGIVATGDGFFSSVKYGTTPSGATVTTSPKTLIIGTEYRVDIQRSDGSTGSKAFVR
jgi:hypothetical protein